MKTTITTLVCLFTVLAPLSVFAAASADAPPAADVSKANPDLDLLYRFVDLVKVNKREEASHLVRYPLRRQEPLSALASAAEFVEHFDEFFDAKTIATVEKEKADTMTSWRGTSIAGGSIYAEGGKIIAINLATERQLAEAKRVTALKKSETHASVGDHEKVTFECSTKNHRVEIQELENKKFRYVSWKPGESRANQPELVVNDGTADFQGTGGNVVYGFKNGAYTYEVLKTELCGATCDSTLTVLKSGHPVTEEVCAGTK